jgi:AcrR family transcriptional regulator
MREIMNKPLRSQPTRDGILEAARRLFGEEGYDRTTIRSIAAAADIHPSMVMRYYGSKEGLFAAAATFDLELPDLSKVPKRDMGTTLVRHFLKRWDAKTGELPALLRVSVTHEQARSRLIEIFRKQVAPAIASICGKERAGVCSALLATQTLGLALTRYVLRLPPVVGLSDDIIVERIGATLQSYLFDD